MSSVLQPWLEEIPIRMQSTLLLGLRGLDLQGFPHSKKIGRWLRGLTFKPGNPANCNEFMGTAPDRILDRSAEAKELEYCPMHFYSHLMHALEVVAYRYPDHTIATHAHSLFEDMCSLLHLLPETRSHFEVRLRTIEWPDGKQPNNFEEAQEQLADKAIWKG